MRDASLWHRIEAHRFDDPAAEFPFSEKLAKTYGWSSRQTAAAIEEYRRFLYLATISPEKVTPSEDVDKVWHLHLTYTRDYWDVLCAEVLGGALHHEPATGPAEAPRFEAQYRHTYALYEEEFGAPPRRFWSRPRDGAPRKRGLLGRAVQFAVVWAALYIGVSWFFGLGEEGRQIAAVITGGMAFVSALPFGGTQGSSFEYGISLGGDGDGGGCGD